MTRSKEDKARFISELSAAAKALGESNPDIPMNLLNNFSPNNCLWILTQQPSATNCAGFHAWKAAGRSVRKGAKGIAIMVPLGKNDDDGKPYFTWRYVFDILETQELGENSPNLLRELELSA